jgi:hypothetical protein
VCPERHASSSVVADSTAQPDSTNRKTLSPIESETLVNEFDVGVFFEQNADLNNDESEIRTEMEDGYAFYIAEGKLRECQKITVKIGKEEVLAILDTRCELTLMNENLYEKICE